MDQYLISRRKALIRLARLGGGVALSGMAGWPLTHHAPLATAAPAPKNVLVEGIGQTDGYSVHALVKKVFDAAGGMNHFVSKGDIVVIKPNLSWARVPNLAATTNPEVLEAVVMLALDVGAKKVRIVDNTIHDARRCFGLTGAAMVAKKTGADLIFPRSSLFRRMDLGGERLKIWPVLVPVVEADSCINLPIAKTHGLTGLTLGIKNWIGGIGGSRWSLHQDIHHSIVDLAAFFKPTVTLIDAIRIMTQNGPSGGSPSDVAVKNTLILSTDPVAGDAKAAGLFGVNPGALNFIALGEKAGLGTARLDPLQQCRVTL